MQASRSAVTRGLAPCLAAPASLSRPRGASHVHPDRTDPQSLDAQIPPRPDGDGRGHVRGARPISGRALAARQGAHGAAGGDRRLFRQRLHLGDQGRRRVAALEARGARSGDRILPLGRAADRDRWRRRGRERRILRREGFRDGRGDQGADRDPGEAGGGGRRRRHHLQGLPRGNRLSQDEGRVLRLPLLDGDAETRNREPAQALPAGRSGGGIVRGLTAHGPSCRGCPMFYHWLFLSLFVLMWGGWFALWNVMAFRVKEAAQSEGRLSRLTHAVPLLVAAYLLFARVPVPLLNDRFIPPAIWSATLGAALTFAGLAFSIWARFVIAGNWSSYVEFKR